MKNLDATESEPNPRKSCGDENIEAMRQACADDCASLERQLEDKEAELAFEEKAHGQTLAERDAARAEVERVTKLWKEAEAFWKQSAQAALANNYEVNRLRAEVERLERYRYEEMDTLNAEVITLRERNAELEEALQAIRALTPSNVDDTPKPAATPPGPSTSD